MTAEFGSFLSALALVLALAQSGLGLIGGARNDARLAAAAAGCAQASALTAGVAFAILISLFLRSDFSVAVVQANSHIAKPLIYKIAGAWGNHQGSILLVSLVSAAFAALLGALRGGMTLPLWSRAVGVQGIVTSALLAYMLLLSSPFARLDPAPLEGRDLNPLLQDPALAIHPPMLYLGYIGLSVPFSLGIAALLEGKADQAWAKALRPWTLIAWTFLTIGITLGAYWAYYELGWGGWWFWDPVENASFMPWLAATALMHSAIVTERRGSLASWTILLSILGFGLALLGAFLVRSGVLTSVHAFAVDPKKGYALLGIMAAFVGGGLTLFAWRAPRLAQPSGFALVSREGALVLNNLGLAVGAGIVLVGTLYPLMVEAASGRLVSVGPPFFNAAFAPLMAALFVLVPFAPFFAWRKADARAAASRLRWAALAAALAMVGTALWLRGGFWAVVGIGVGVWLMAGALAYFRDRTGGESARRLPHLSLAFWAMMLAHAGLGAFVLGAVAETAFRQETSAQMRVGDSVEFAGRKITLASVGTYDASNYSADRAEFRVERGASLRLMHPERRFYFAAGSPTTEVAIATGLEGDLYIAFGEAVRNASGSPSWTVRFYLNPLLYLIFIGTGMMAAGGFVGVVALARKRAAARKQSRATVAEGATA